MKKRSLNISGKINAERINAIIAVQSIAGRCNVPIFITGATARDFVIEYAFGIKAPRATVDIDFGILVQSWKQFEKLASSLSDSGHFKRMEYRYRFRFDDYQPIDILPFGPLANEQQVIRLPGSESIEMDTAGYEEAFQYAFDVQIQENPPVFIKIADPACLAIMKLVSWHEKYPDRDKDAKDFHFIMLHYLEFDNLESAYGNHPDLMSLQDFDFETTGARILGRDMRTVSTANTVQKIEAILIKETDPSGTYKLLREMREMPYFPEDFSKNLSLLEHVKRGFLEKMLS